MVIAIELVLLVSSIWVLFDAKNYDWSQSGFARSAGAWFAGALLFWIIVFPLYLAARHKAPRKGARPGPPAFEPAPASSVGTSATSVAPPGFSD